MYAPDDVVVVLDRHRVRFRRRDLHEPQGSLLQRSLNERPRQHGKHARIQRTETMCQTRGLPAGLMQG